MYRDGGPAEDVYDYGLLSDRHSDDDVRQPGVKEASIIGAFQPEVQRKLTDNSSDLTTVYGQDLNIFSDGNNDITLSDVNSDICRSQWCRYNTIYCFPSSSDISMGSSASYSTTGLFDAEPELQAETENDRVSVGNTPTDQRAEDTSARMLPLQSRMMKLTRQRINENENWTEDESETEDRPQSQVPLPTANSHSDDDYQDRRRYEKV